MNYASAIQRGIGGFIINTFETLEEAENEYKEAMELGARSGFVFAIIEGQYNEKVYKPKNLPFEFLPAKLFDKAVEQMETEYSETQEND
tara:strand:- start:23356 stop:23622 length:267 start_codon:yes stop_codon:yes gene_type:complete